jgi:uncharacterized protein YcbX
MTPVLCEIRVYPIKSLDPVTVEEARIVAGGGLEYDRSWAMVDRAGGFITGKRNAAVHRLRTGYDLANRTVAFSSGPAFRLVEDAGPLAAWLSDYFAEAVEIQYNPCGGFPDDTAAPGPTILSANTLEAVSSWFGLTTESVRRRFRANLELEGIPAFWEDQLYGRAGEVVRFQIGNIRFEGINPCQRCVVPSRDPDSGCASELFQKRFADQRRQTLPAWAEVSRFDHYYRLAVNTRIPGSEIGKVLRVGDVVRIES